jgi:hypothetical protein
MHKSTTKSRSHIVLPIVGSHTYAFLPIDQNDAFEYTTILVTVTEDWLIWRMMLDGKTIHWRAIHTRSMAKGLALKNKWTHRELWSTAFIGFNKLQQIAHHWGGVILNKDGTPMNPLNPYTESDQ